MILLLRQLSFILSVGQRRFPSQLHFDHCNDLTIISLVDHIIHSGLFPFPSLLVLPSPHPSASYFLPLPPHATLSSFALPPYRQK